MSHRIRELGESDLEQVSEWESLCFPTEIWSKKNILTHLEFHKAYVLEIPIPVAYTLVCETPWEVEIFRIATLPEFRKKGYGKMLMEEIFRIFPGKDFFLEVNESNQAAQNLYLAVGFKELEKRKNYYPDGSSALLMKKEKL
ncbi:MAG: GNAT family N-acetyltransferase [Leptospira sp.]|nr:GNAT family N-acetyltransferase [Leptospira sp.]